MRAFRFGVVASPPQSRQAWREQARRAEALGYATLQIWDHFDAQLAPLPALVAAADATSTLRLGTQVLANDFRHPALLAREAATADLLSDGRLELGLGAGWKAEEYRRAGLAFDPAPVRVERLRESVQILRRLFAGGPVWFAGAHYRIDGLEGLPRPAQPHGPPLMIGGARRRMLELAAQEADTVAFATKVFPDGRHDFAESTGPRMRERVGWVRAAAGARLGRLELHIHIGGVVLTDDPAGTAAALGPTVGLDGPQLLDCLQALVGTRESIAETLLRRRAEYGISYITVGAESMDALAPVVARLSGL